MGSKLLIEGITFKNIIIEGITLKNIIITHEGKIFTNYIIVEIYNISVNQYLFYEN